MAKRRICDYENSTYRTDFWEGQGREYEDRAERIALRAMLPVRGRRIVEVGAGFGRLADLYDGYQEVVLVDYSRSQLEFARRKLGDGRFIYVAADLYRLPLADGSVDAAVMVRVLHHLEDVSGALAQLARALVGGGALVLEFANKRHLKNLIRWALGRGVKPWDQAPYQFADLHYDFHPLWVQDRLREQGLEVLARRSVSLFRLGLLKRALSAKFLARLDGLQQRCLARAYLAPSVFVQCRRRDGGETGHAVSEALFRCPECGAEPLALTPDGACCSACGRSWLRVNGVYVFK